MKSKLILVLVSAALLFSYPAASYAWRGGYGGYYHPAPRAVYHHGHSGNSAVPYLVGGLLVGTVLGAVLSQPSYAPPPPAPAPVTYEYPAPSYSSEEPPGEWVSVPGRWVEGKWVPAHRVWVPVNP